MKDLLVMAVCGTVDSGISMYFRGLKRIAKKIERMRGQQNPKVHLLQQFSLYWVSHTEPLKDGILLSYEEFSRAVRRFSKFYNEHTLEEQLKSFYAIAVSVWRRFKTPPTNEQIKHALLEIAAKMLDSDFQRSHSSSSTNTTSSQLSAVQASEMSLGDCLFNIAKSFYQEKRALNEKSFINQFFNAFEGILIKGEEKYVQLCKDYHRFLRDVINVHFSSKLENSPPHSHERSLLKNLAIYAMEMYIKTATYPLYPLEDLINMFLSESTQQIVAHNFRPQRIAVSDNTISKLQLQIQILGIKGFLVWKQVFARIQIYKGLSLQERINMIGVVGLVKELVLFAPIIHLNTVQLKTMKDELVLRIAKHVRLSKKKIALYHGIVRKQWIEFKIKSIEHARYILNELATKAQELNLTVNTMYQEALRTIRNKRESLLLSKSITAGNSILTVSSRKQSQAAETPLAQESTTYQPFCHPESEDLPTFADQEQEEEEEEEQLFNGEKNSNNRIRSQEDSVDKVDEKQEEVSHDSNEQEQQEQEQPLLI